MAPALRKASAAPSVREENRTHGPFLAL
jgi:hypothetical protein